MAQTNFTPISLYYSATATNVPTAGNLVAGELAINTADGKLFYKDSAGVVQTIASKAGALGDVVGPASATDNAISRFDATTGKLIQNSLVTVSDTGAISAPVDASISGLTVGKGASAVATNTALGVSALAANTTASRNTAIGYQAGYTNTTNIASTYVGYRAGYLATGAQCTFVGDNAGQNSTGTLNGFFGQAAGYLVTSGAKNTIIGSFDGNQGGLDIRTASNYIVLSDGDGNPRGFFDASGNLLVGETTQRARLSVTTGNDECIFAINSAGASSATMCSWNNAGTGNNYLHAFFVDAGASNVGNIDYNRAAGLLRYNVTSDATLKNIIGDSNGQRSLEILNTTRIRDFAWKSDTEQKTQIGVIAQELYETYKGAVSVGGENEEGKYRPWGVDKTAFTFHLIAGWQAHEKIIQELNAKVTALEAQINGA